MVCCSEAFYARVGKDEKDVKQAACEDPSSVMAAGPAPIMATGSPNKGGRPVCKDPLGKRWA